jgi:hypothetical protein
MEKHMEVMKKESDTEGDGGSKDGRCPKGVVESGGDVAIKTLPL